MMLTILEQNNSKMIVSIHVSDICRVSGRQFSPFFSFWRSDMKNLDVLFSVLTVFSE